jgi:hypothetical protein
MGVSIYTTIYTSLKCYRTRDRRMNFFHSNCGWTSCKTHPSKNQKLKFTLYLRSHYSDGMATDCLLICPGYQILNHVCKYNTSKQGDFKFFPGIGFPLVVCPIFQPRQMGTDFHSIYGNMHTVRTNLPSVCGTGDSQRSSASSTCNKYMTNFMSWSFIFKKIKYYRMQIFWINA